METTRLILCILLCLKQTILFSNGVFYKIRKSECIANKNHIENVSCVLKPINWTRSEINMDCDIVDKITDLRMAVDVFYRDSVNLYKPFAVRFNFPICHLLRRMKQSNFLESYAIEHLKTMTNVNHSCPISGHLTARNFHLDEISLPRLPSQDYKIAFTFSDIKPNRHLGVILVYFEVLEDYYKKKGPKPRTKPHNFDWKIYLSPLN